MDTPRLPLADLITEYSLHTDRRHLYVEGREDRAIFEWFIESISLKGVQVLEIDSVEITPSDLQKHGLNSGNKSSLLVLVRELDRSLSGVTPSILAIIDADWDYIFDKTEENRFLAYTDGTSLEMYLFSASVLNRVLRLGFKDRASDASQILEALRTPLTEVFVIRATNEKLGLGLKWLPFEKRCKVDSDGNIKFSPEDFVRHYLMKNGKLGKIGDFNGCRTKLWSRVSSDCTRWIRGHDYVLLLSRYLREKYASKEIKELARIEAIGRMLFVALDIEDLQKAPLFQKIISVFS